MCVFSRLNQTNIYIHIYVYIQEKLNFQHVGSINRVNPFLTPRKGSSGKVPSFFTFSGSSTYKSSGSRCNLEPWKRKEIVVVIQSSVLGLPSGGFATLMAESGTMAIRCWSSELDSLLTSFAVPSMVYKYA